MSESIRKSGRTERINQRHGRSAARSPSMKRSVEMAERSFRTSAGRVATHPSTAARRAGARRPSPRNVDRRLSKSSCAPGGTRTPLARLAGRYIQGQPARYLRRQDSAVRHLYASEIRSMQCRCCIGCCITSGAACSRLPLPGAPVARRKRTRAESRPRWAPGASPHGTPCRVSRSSARSTRWDPQLHWPSCRRARPRGREAVHRRRSRRGRNRHAIERIPHQ